MRLWLQVRRLKIQRIWSICQISKTRPQTNWLFRKEEKVEQQGEEYFPFTSSLEESEVGPRAPFICL